MYYTGMELFERSETWQGENNFRLNLYDIEGRVSWYAGAVGARHSASSWSEAERVAREEFARRCPGVAMTLHGRCWRWRQVTDGEARFQRVLMSPSRELSRMVAWDVQFRRWVGPWNDHAVVSECEQKGYTATWEEGIEAGRKMLGVFASLPFP